MHIVQPPRIGRIAADPGRTLQRRSLFGSVVRLLLEVRLLVAQLVAKSRSGRSSRATGIFPLRFGRKSKLPARW
jgi:hypothetical protein